MNKRALVIALAVLYLFCIFPSVYGSTISGGGKTTVCGGTGLSTCSPTDRVARPVLGNFGTNSDAYWTDSGPQVGIPFINDFGLREVRLTDGNIPGNVSGLAWRGPNNMGQQYWSVYDPSFGGYLAYAGTDNTNNYYLFQVNSSSLTATPLCETGGPAACAMPYYSLGTFSNVTPGLLYFASGSSIEAYNYDTNSGPTTVFDFSTCPGISNVTGVGGDNINYGITVDHTDTIFTAGVGNSIMGAYDRTTGSCYWLSTVYGLSGGTGQSNPVAASLTDTVAGYTNTAWPVAPSLGSPSGATGGSLVAGTTYYIQVTEMIGCQSSYGNGAGCGSGNYQYVSETDPSSEISFQVPAGDTAISLPITTSGSPLEALKGSCNVYMSTTSGAETFQQNVLCKKTSSNFTITGPINSSSTTPSTSNKAGFTFHSVNAAGTNAPSSGSVWMMQSPACITGGGCSGVSVYNIFWQPFDSNGNLQTSAYICQFNGGCDGHVDMGTNGAFYIISGPQTNGVPAHYDSGLGSYSATQNTGQYTRLEPSGPPTFNTYNPNTECNVSDTHPNWSFDNQSDTSPIVVGSFVDSAVPGFSLTQIHCAWDHELYSIASPGVSASGVLNGSGLTHRLMHLRSTGAQNPLAGDDTSYNALGIPDCTDDGKLCMIASDWNWGLGDAVATTLSGDSPDDGCAGQFRCQWQPNFNYSKYQSIIDSNGNVEIAQGTGETGAGPVPWPMTVGGTVVDGGVTWLMYPGCNTPQTTSTKGMCRTDVFIVEAVAPNPD